MEDMEMKLSSWKGRRVLVTGHTGFKGSWLSLWLDRLGAHVTGLSLDPPSSPNLFTDARVADRVDDRRGDIRDASLVSAVIEETRPQVILHLAAQAIVRAGYKEPIETFETNIMGTAYIIDAASRCSDTQAVLAVTTDKCYRNDGGSHAFIEDDPLGGDDPYSASKAAAEIVGHALRNVHTNTLIATARAGNVIGGGDWGQDRLVPDLVRAFIAGSSTPIRNPDAIRPWQHVLDPLSGYLQLADAMLQGRVDVARGWNFGPLADDARTVRWIADESTRLWGDNAGWHHDTAEHPHEAPFLRLNARRAMEELNWRPRLTVEESIAWTIDWYRESKGNADPASLCLAQLETFEAHLQERSE